MPTSQHHQISTIVDAIIALKPQSVLDIGVGFGKYGVLCREYLELWDGRESYGAFTRRIDGIEAFEPYLTPLHAYIYDHIYIGDALTIIPTLEERYDLVLLIDVLEHFTKTQGQKLIQTLLARNKNIVISVPKDIGEQEDAFGNPFETHRASWRPSELERFGPHKRLSNATSHIIVLGQRSSIIQLERALAKQELEKIIYAHPWLARLYRGILGLRK